jgi:potassium/sodium efflux P-type ATPase
VTAADATKPPLVIKMERFAGQTSIVILAATALLAVIALAQGIPWMEVFFLAVALAVSAIPEGLPVAITVVLSIATSRMARRAVIVRRLTAVEGLGSCTYIASDKTGTLTVNQQTAKTISLPGGRRFAVSGEGYAGEGEITSVDGESLAADERDDLEQLIRASMLANEGRLTQEDGEWMQQGDAVDVALLALGHKFGLSPLQVRQEATILGEIPFESERSYSALFYRQGSRVQVAVKGAIETLLPLCREMQGEQGPVPMDAEAIEQEALSLSEDGYRVLGIATGVLEGVTASQQLDEDALPPLTLLGLVGFIDPLRPEVKEAVAKCRRAGIEVAMITGDHPATALAIARELGIADSPDAVITGKQLATIGTAEDPEFVEMVKGSRVFARVAPLQKLHIVEALGELGHYVAVTGDGVNDAPALRQANIGVAMGSGTDVAKDTASLIVTDDNFASIEAGVEEGRFAYDNIRKVTYLLISTGAAEVLLFTLALVAGLPLPLFAVQILWLNLVTNGIQDVALAFEAGEPGAMDRPPRRPEEGIFDSLMIQQTVMSGATIGLISIAVWYTLLQWGWEEEMARNLLLLMIVLFQNFHVFNCRSERVSAFRIPLRNNWPLVAGVAAAFGIHMLSMHIPLMQSILGVAPVSLNEFFTLLVIASSILIVMEIFKATLPSRYKRIKQPA